MAIRPLAKGMSSGNSALRKGDLLGDRAEAGDEPERRRAIPRRSGGAAHWG